jgi:hypothetical protein
MMNIFITLFENVNKSCTSAGSLSLMLFFFLKIPRSLEQPEWSKGWFQYVLEVVAVGDVSFNQTQDMDFYEKSFSIFVQTDKAMYKPGQTGMLIVQQS